MMVLPSDIALIAGADSPFPEWVREAVAELADEVADMREDWLSPDEIEERVQDEREELERELRKDYEDERLPLVEDAHRILGDLAWRATAGDPSAQAAEAELRDFLIRVRDMTA